MVKAAISIVAEKPLEKNIRQRVPFTVEEMKGDVFCVEKGTSIRSKKKLADLLKDAPAIKSMLIDSGFAPSDLEEDVNDEEDADVTDEEDEME